MISAGYPVYNLWFRRGWMRLLYNCRDLSLLPLSQLNLFPASVIWPANDFLSGLTPSAFGRTHKEPSQKFLSRLWSVKASKPFRVSHPQCYRMVLGGRATMQTALLLPSEMFNSMPQSRGRVRSTPQVPMWFIRNKQLSNQSGSRISKEQSSLLLCKPHL